MQRALLNFLVTRVSPRTAKRLFLYLKNEFHPDDLVAQGAEDVALSKVFHDKLASKEPGFYVDVGCYDPVVASNTHFFSQRGWRGINIEPNPACAERLKAMRPRDINLAMAVGRQVERRFLKVPIGFAEVSTLDEGYLKSLGVSEPEQIEVAVRPLKSILDEYLPLGQAIDFLDVDVEGLDLEVLQSNDWTRHRPRVVIAEFKAGDFHSLLDHEIARYLASQGYQPFYKALLPHVMKHGLGSVMFFDARVGYGQIFTN